MPSSSIKIQKNCRGALTTVGRSKRGQVGGGGGGLWRTAKGRTKRSPIRPVKRLTAEGANFIGLNYQLVKDKCSRNKGQGENAPGGGNIMKRNSHRRKETLLVETCGDANRRHFPFGKVKNWAGRERGRERGPWVPGGLAEDGRKKRETTMQLGPTDGAKNRRAEFRHRLPFTPEKRTESQIFKKRKRQD